MSRVLVALLALALLAPSPSSAQRRRARVARAAAPVLDSDGETAMLARINQLRGEEGVPPLERHPGLDAAAQAHSVDMASHEERGQRLGTKEPADAQETVQDAVQQTVQTRRLH